MKNRLKKKVIDIYIHSYAHIYGNYYMPGDPHLDTHLLSHLLLLASETKMTGKLEIRVWQKEAGDHKKFTTALKNTLNDTINGVEKEVRVNSTVALISLIAGIVVGVLATNMAVSNEQLSSVILIAFWVFIWYSVETYVFDNFKLRMEIRRYQQLIDADINFQVIPVS